MNRKNSVQLMSLVLNFFETKPIALIGQNRQFVGHEQKELSTTYEFGIKLF
jgi:hypothetical protein